MADIKKPPLGLMPREIFIQERLKDINQAIGRMVETNYPIPVEWIQERQGILEELGRVEYV